MTNREYIIRLLQDEDCFDDKTLYEDMVRNAINCPPYGNCSSSGTCFVCKENWLDSNALTDWD